MLAIGDFGGVLEGIRAVSTLTETKLLEIGQALQAAAETLSRLIANFEAVLSELTGQPLAEAIDALTKAATSVAELDGSRGNETTGFDRLRQVAGSIAGRLRKMLKSVRAVEALAVNSKIAASGITVSGTDFSTFAEEIGRPLAVASGSLGRFNEELTIVRQNIAAAHAGQTAFEARQADAIRSIPHRLLGTVRSIQHQLARAANAGADVKRRSELVHQQLCSAIMALQIGDATRQRLEHADRALDLLDKAMDPGNADGPLGPVERRALAITTCRLQSAQLVDAEQQFSRDVRQIIKSLRTIGTEAAAVRNLGKSAFGTSGNGTFIAELEGQVGQAVRLFEGFGTAQREAARIAKSVSDATASLHGHLDQVQTLEADIRIMGLNTTLKCARIGPEGMALSIIAQELRTYANEFNREARALMTEVQNVVTVTDVLCEDRPAEATLAASAIGRGMQSALLTLQSLGGMLVGAMADLQTDTQDVIERLERTVTGLETDDQISAALQRACRTLAAASPPGGIPLADLTDRTHAVLAAMERNYTMVGERRVHDRILGRASAAVAVLPPSQEEELEDMLF